MPENKKRVCWSSVILFSYIGVVMLLTLIKIERPHEVSFTSFLGIEMDKWAHFIMFLPLAMCLFLFLKWNSIPFDIPRFFWSVLCAGIIWGLAIELLQGNATTYRGEDPYDLLADSIGTLAGLIIVLAFGTTIEKWVGKILRI